MGTPPRIAAPNPRGYAPNELEQTFAQGLSGPNGALMAPYFLAAQMGRMNGSADYSLALENSNRLAMQEGAAERAAEADKTAATLTGVALAHPGAAQAFAPSARLLTSPEVGQELYSLRNLRERSAAFEDYGQGANAMDQAGLRMPAGSTYSFTGGPSGDDVQGTSRALQLQAAQAASAASRRAATAGSGGGLTRLEAQMKLAAYRDQLGDGNRANMQEYNLGRDANREDLRAGRGATPAQIEAAVARERATIERAAGNEFNPAARARVRAEGEARLNGIRERLSEPRQAPPQAAVEGSAPPPPNAAPQAQAAPAAAPRASQLADARALRERVRSQAGDPNLRVDVRPRLDGQGFVAEYTGRDGRRVQVPQ